MSRLTYTDKVALNVNAGIPAQNKIVDSDMNNIKNAINQIGMYTNATVATGLPGKCYILMTGVLATGDIFDIVLPNSVNPSATAQFSVDGGVNYYPIVRATDGSGQLVSEVAGKRVTMFFNGTAFVIGNMAFTDDWIPINDAITYASVSTITVPAGGLLKYKKGDRLKLVQSGSLKYFNIINVADTLLTINGGSDYTLTNSAISGAYFSHSVNPIGFPAYFNWLPTLTGITKGNGVLIATYSVIGSQFFFFFGFTLGSTSAITGRNFVTFPFNVQGGGIANSYIEDYITVALIGVSLIAPTGFYNDVFGTASPYASQVYFSATVPFTWTTNDFYRVSGSCAY